MKQEVKDVGPKSLPFARLRAFSPEIETFSLDFIHFAVKQNGGPHPAHPETYTDAK
jgi:hypothetical protein